MMRKPMDSEFHLRGKWWLPGSDEPEDGQLHFSPSTGIELDLGGVLQDGEGGAPGAPPIIHGRTEVGPATLIETHRSPGEIHIHQGGGYGSHLYNARYLTVGGLLEDGIETEADWMSTTFSHLEEWAGVSVSPDHERAPEEVVISLEDAEDEEWQSDAVPGTVKLTHSGRWDREGQTKISITQESYIRLQPENTMSLGDLRSTFEEVQLFLSLTVGFPVYPLRMFFEAADDGVGHGSPLRMYFSQGSIDIPRPWPGAFHVLARDDFGDLLPEALDAWFEEAETHEPLRDLVLGGRYNPSHRPSLRFLTLTKALEGYHRRRHGGHYQTQENYEETRNHLWSEIPDGLTQGHRAALRSRIRYGYQYSLRKRLTDLIERTPPSMPPMIETDRSGFVDVVVDTRNQHTHHDPENEDDILEGEQLSLANDALEALATFLMLQDINAPDEQIVDGLSSSVRFNHLWDED